MSYEFWIMAYITSWITWWVHYCREDRDKRPSDYIAYLIKAAFSAVGTMILLIIASALFTWVKKWSPLI